MKKSGIFHIEIFLLRFTHKLRKKYRGISETPDNRAIEKQTIACCAEYKGELISVTTTFK